MDIFGDVPLVKRLQVLENIPTLKICESTILENLFSHVLYFKTSKNALYTWYAIFLEKNIK